MPRVTITVPDKIPQPYRFLLERQVVVIGRGSQNDIVVDCGSMSTRHAEMVRIEGGYELRDLGSTNGIKLDDKRSDVIPLRHGMTVKMGDVAFDFQLSEEEREALAREKVLDEVPFLKTDTEIGVVKEDGTNAEPAAEPKKRTAGSSSDSGRGFMKFLLLAVFTFVAFFCGLSLRHCKDTGGLLYQDMTRKTKTLKAKTEQPAPPTTPAPNPDPFAPIPPTTPAPAPSPPPQ